MTLKSRIAALILAASLTSCSSSRYGDMSGAGFSREGRGDASVYGGGTVGTGLPDGGQGDAASGSSAELSTSRPASAEISGTVSDENGKPIADLPLVIETPLQTQRVRTDVKGRFAVSLRAGEKDTVSFELDGEGRLGRTHWTYRAQGSRAVRLVLGADRKLRVVE